MWLLKGEELMGAAEQQRSMPRPTVWVEGATNCSHSTLHPCSRLHPAHPPTYSPPPQDKHSLELKVARQRVKHLLYEQGAAVARLKAEGEAALKSQVCGWLGQLEWTTN